MRKCLTSLYFGIQTDGIIAAILASTTMAQQSEVKAWEEEIESCKHSKELVQEASKQLEQSGRLLFDTRHAVLALTIKQAWHTVVAASSTITFGSA